MIYYHYGIMKRQENLQLLLFKNHQPSEQQMRKLKEVYPFTYI